jgi:short-subunit dehydrogenase
MSLKNKVVVITGASSGIGRAAALAFAARGSYLVLGARRSEALESVARACRAAGGQVLVQPTDVTREEDVQTLARRALEPTGAIDVWVNNAGVTLFGSLEAAPLDEHRRVIETNLFGAMHGARAVIPIFRRQRRGVLINVGSVLSKIGQSFVPSYVVSKFALRGLSEALRAELADELDIHVCTLLPYAVDTEHFESGANHMGRSAHALPPMQSPEKVARALVALAERPRRELHVPRVALLGLALHAAWPRSTERILLDALSRWHLGPESEPQKSGNLNRPERSNGDVHGKRQPLVSAFGLAWYAARRFPVVAAELAVHAVTSRIGPRRRSAATEAAVSAPRGEQARGGPSLEAKLVELQAAGRG